ncbi:Bug family tripartite tricarboxylate transporter substrate binding protein [Dankookia sp. P2]|uniref:Bug family tripartite tricarboxylate transporter substrate binding protein n=1 Tax=Dankookia sp. P2 TaxID=3423955 RepID=UPI003D66539B
MPTRRALLGALAAPACPSMALLPRAAHAAWPERPVRVIVPFAAGGNTDVMARTVLAAMGETLGRISSSRTVPAGPAASGPSSRRGPHRTAISLLAGSGGSLTANPVLQANLPYDPLRDFAPIGLLARVPNVLILAPRMTQRSWPELLAAAKAAPGSLNIASPAIGTTGHFALELLNHATGAGLVHVPYRGGGSLVADLLAGNFDGAILELSTALPLHQEGKARILAVAAAQRVPQMPEVPTFIEGGVPGFTSTSFTALLGPARMPAEIVAALREAAVQALATPAVAQRLVSLGATPATPEEATPAGLTAYLVAELARYRQAAQLAGLRPQ